MCIDIHRRKLLLVNPGKVKQVISNSRLVFRPGFEKNMITIKRFRYIEVIFRIFNFLGEECRSL